MEAEAVSRINAVEQIRKFAEFIETNYYNKLLENARKGEKLLLVDFSELSKFDPDLAVELLDMPEETIKITLLLKKSSVDFFKHKANKCHTKYQKMIRELVDRYAAQYSSIK